MECYQELLNTKLMPWLIPTKWGLKLKNMVDTAFAKIEDATNRDIEDIDPQVKDFIYTLCLERLLSDNHPLRTSAIEQFIKKHNRNLNYTEIAYLNSLSNSHFGFYEVLDTDNEDTVLLKNKIQDGKPIKIVDEVIAKEKHRFKYIAARIVSNGEYQHPTSTVFPLSYDIFMNIVRPCKRNIKNIPIEEMKRITQKHGSKYEMAINSIFDEFLEILIKHYTGPPKPVRFTNTDGHPLRQCIATFTFDKKDQQEIIKKLNAVDRIVDNEELNWDIGKDPPIHDEESGITITKTIVGTIRIERNQLILESNSVVRINNNIELLREIIGDKISPPEIEETEFDISQFSAPQSNSLDLDDEVVKKALNMTIKTNLLDSLDEIVPMVSTTKTPREAIKSPRGLNKVIEWIKRLEYEHAKNEDDVDLSFLIKELGIEKEYHSKQISLEKAG